MKILYVTTVGSTMHFFKTFVGDLIQKGHQVDIATNNSITSVPDVYQEMGCVVYPLSCSRNPLACGNLKAIGEIKKLVVQNGYDLVHCHTPIAAACTRLACRSLRKKGVKVYYTAHGFHFFKGAPLKNWLIYYPVEKFCAHFTDMLITMNQEDYALAKKSLRAKQVVYVPGVGIDLNKFGKSTADKLEKRKELGIPEGAPWLLNIGELIPRKNQETIIRAVSNIPNVYLTIAGRGPLDQYLKDLACELGVEDRVKVLGFRTDINDLCHSADAYVFASFHEGLPVAVMESMANGLPCVVSRIRGNVDLIDEKGGVLFNPHDAVDCQNAIQKLLSMDLKSLGDRNKTFIQDFSIENVMSYMYRFYNL